VHLGNSVHLVGNPSTTNLALLDRVRITQGTKHEYKVQATGGPLSVTLVWNDYPAPPAAERILIIDLDLAVRPAGLNGTLLLGNGGSAAGAALPDRENTVQRVALQRFPAGEVTITVVGANVSDWLPLPATYALVVQGNFSGSLERPDAPSPAELFAASPVVTSGPAALPTAVQPPLSLSLATASQVRSAAGVHCCGAKLGDQLLCRLDRSLSIRC
jgi:hypothetical protein